MAILVAIAVVGVGQTYAIIPLIRVIADDLGASTAATSWAATTFSVTFALGTLLVGPAADRFGPRRVILVGLVATIGTTVLVAGSPTLPILVACRGLQGMAVATLAPTAFAYVAANIEPRRRPMALGMLSSAGLSSAVLMQVAAQLLGVVDWRAVFAVSAVMFAAAVVAVRYGLPADRTADRASSAKSAAGVLLGLLTRRRLLALYLCAATLLGSLVVLYTAIQLAGPAAVSDSPTALLALRASSLPAMIVAPWPVTATPLSVRTTALVAVGAAATAAASTGLLAQSVVGLGAALFCYILGVAVAAPCLVQLIHARAPAAIGGATALYTAALFIGTSAGAPLAAAVVGAGFAAAAALTAALLVAGGIGVLAGAR